MDLKVVPFDPGSLRRKPADHTVLSVVISRTDSGEDYFLEFEEKDREGKNKSTVITDAALREMGIEPKSVGSGDIIRLAI